MQSSLGRRFTATLGLVLSSAGVFAQSNPIAPVQGQITDAVANSPLPGAVVRWLEAADASATTDAAGKFTLVRPARGRPVT
ncbi:hypothetical protein [Hymenobacter cellulosilyticus]|uniref:Carboxypeptidase regulatory-like domain-containing protein n=1 Tax=Hymenobacter cellulosilyticus TaxID=2932248 RepID=A0A8T9QB74_9BACT|nr:hypothetical protein [Hymenobacter cellulosilyticus]UOQ74757.1 hypothetical protein MUN79_13290 [Hymenobacter cellulosilyticus]